MIRVAVEAFRNMAARPKRIVSALLGAAVRGSVQCVPGVNVVTNLIRELGDFGVDRLADPNAEIDGLKPAGEAFPPEELDQINEWLGRLNASYEGLAEKLDRVVHMQEHELFTESVESVRKALEANEELAKQFDGCTKDVRTQALSLRRVEEKLDEHFHAQKRLNWSIEEIKGMLVDSPMMGEWATFRKARPDALQAIADADEHFLAGRRDEGARLLVDLLKQRGVGSATLARQLGLVCVADGRVRDAMTHLQAAGPDAQGVLTRGLTSLSTFTGRPAGPGGWRSLPRGFIVDSRYRVEEEVGRGGMASVYRVIGIDLVNEGEEFALKVPAPGLMDGSTAQRFVQEIRIAHRLSHGRHPRIVATHNYVRFNDPFTKKEVYGMVMEFVRGRSLAHFLAERKAESKPLPPDEIRRILLEVCEALEYAHSQNPPVLHRDVKPFNVMIAADGATKLMDFGIARVLDDTRESTTTAGGMRFGTPAYMPPELFGAGAPVDARVDVYLAGNLLLELMTLSPTGIADERTDCPAEWLELIGDSMSRILAKRPKSIAEFARRLRDQPTPSEAPPPLPRPELGQSTTDVTVPSLVVDVHGRGDCRTIGEALFRAKEGATIRVRPGIYKEGVVINRAVELIGDGDREDIVIENDAGNALQMRAEQAAIRGITFRTVAGTSTKEVFAVYVPQGKLVMTDCDITSDSLSCIGIHGARTEPVFRRCAIHDGRQCGVFVYDRSKATFEGCDLFNNRLAGAEVNDGGELNLHDCTVRGSREGSGLYFHGESRGTLDGCDIHSNKLAGIAIRERSNPIVRNSRVRDGVQTGIHIYEQGRGAFENCEIYGNKLAGVEVKEEARTAFRRCKLRDGEQTGIYVHSQGRCTLETCEIVGNRLSGIEIKQDGDLVAKSTTIRGAKDSCGILVHEKGKAAFEDCEILENKLAGVEVRSRGDATLRRCRIQRNRFEAVYVHNNGQAMVEDCDLTGNGGKGSFDIRDGCEVKRRNNREP